MTLGESVVQEEAERSPGEVGGRSFSVRELVRADTLGLVAMWSRAFGFIAVHDPTTGEWHDVAVDDCEPWMVWEARKRKELKKYNGSTRMLSASEMEAIWKQEQAKMWEGQSFGVTEGGMVYEDYLEEEELEA